MPAVLMHTEPSSTDVVKRFTSLARKHEVTASGMLGLPSAQNVDRLLIQRNVPRPTGLCLQPLDCEVGDHEIDLGPGQAKDLATPKSGDER